MAGEKDTLFNSLIFMMQRHYNTRAQARHVTLSLIISKCLLIVNLAHIPTTAHSKRLTYVPGLTTFPVSVFHFLVTVSDTHAIIV